MGDQISKLRNLLNRVYPQAISRFYFEINNSIARLFRKCDVPEVMMSSSLIYKYTCDCSLQYIGSTQLQLFRRVSQHRGVSFRTGIPLSKQDNSVIRDHCNSHNHQIELSSLAVLDHCHNRDDLHILETLHIHVQRPLLITNQYVVTVYML